MKAMDFKGRWVLVTGASAGLGKAMCVELAKEHGANLVLVARRADVLETFATQLRSDHKVEVKVLPADLGDEDQAGKVITDALAQVPLYAAVLNAGVTHFGHHDHLSWADFKKMLALNVTSQVRMCTELIPHLEKQRHGGGILIVSSMAGLAPVPYQTAYAATKAFLVQYAAGLHHEMWTRGVSVSAFAPGGIATEMTQSAEFDELRAWLMPADVVARSGIRSFKNRGYVSIPGFVYQAGAILQRFVPQRFFVGQLATRYRKSLAALAAKNGK